MENAPDILRFFRPSGIPYAILILLVTWIAARLVVRSLDRLGSRFADKRLLINQAASLLRFALYIVGGVAAAAFVLVLSREVLFAVGGTVAVSIGFAIKDLVASLVAGLIILVDRPFQVGDRVTFGEHYGEIRDIGLRSVRLVTLDDNVITIPNNKFLTDVVASGNAGEVEMMVVMDFHIGIDQDVAKAKEVVEEALTTSRYVALDKPWTVLVTQGIHDRYYAVRLRAKAYVLDVRFEKAFETDVHERVLAAFRGAGIAPPAVLLRWSADSESTTRSHR